MLPYLSKWKILEKDLKYFRRILNQKWDFISAIYKFFVGTIIKGDKMNKRLSLLLILFVLILYPQISHGNSENYIEIFDPHENKVIKKVELTKEINDMVINWIKEINEIHPSINPIKDNGYAIKFPFEAPVEVKNKWMNARVEEVYLVVPKEEAAFFVIFERENRPLFFLFPGEVDKLSEALDFQLR